MQNNFTHVFDRQGDSTFNTFNDYSKWLSGKIPFRFSKHIKKNGTVMSQIEPIILEKMKDIYCNIDNEQTGFYFNGESGCGKTHRLWLLSLALLSNDFKQNSKVLNCLKMIDVIYDNKRGLDTPYNQDDVENYPGTLFLDEFGEDFNSDASLRIIKSILDYRYSHKLYTTLASNISLKEISEKYDDRISNRIKEMCYIIPVKN
jgi:DNA replication protein DnaC